MKNNLLVILSFLITTICMCIANFILQVALIFVDVFTRMQSTSAMVIVLWVVTGVFSTIFTMATASLFFTKEQLTYKLVSKPVFLFSLAAILVGILMIRMGGFAKNPSEFSLLFSNGYVFIAFFSGSALMAYLFRNID